MNHCTVPTLMFSQMTNLDKLLFNMIHFWGSQFLTATKKYLDLKTRTNKLSPSFHLLVVLNNVTEILLYRYYIRKKLNDFIYFTHFSKVICFLEN